MDQSDHSKSADVSPQSPPTPGGVEERRIAIVSAAIGQDTELLSKHLGRSGYQIQLFDATADLIQAIKKFRPHAILFDLEEPRATGYQCLQRLHEKLGWLQAPLIVLSSLAFQSDLQRAIDMGANRYLVKPIAASSLLAILREETETSSNFLH